MDIYEIPDFYNDFKAKPDETLYEHTLNLLKNMEKLSEISNFKYMKLLRIACIFHDIGKISPLFQARLESGKKFNSKTEVGHNIISAAILNKIFKSLTYIEKTEKIMVLWAVLNHHRYVDNISYLRENSELVKSNLKEISDLMAMESIGTISPRRLADLLKLKFNPSVESILLKGFLHKCDYSASSHRDVEILDNSLGLRLDNLGYKWNEMQLFAKNNHDENIILIGSTGLGKTEASLLWLNESKGFYVLPLKTAINAMYERIREQLYFEDYETKLGLLHGDTKRYYLHNIFEDESEFEKYQDYYAITRNFSLPLTISTPDQIFKFVYKYPSYELSLATYSYSKIIIDEIQAYSPELLAYLIYGLQRISDVGGKFAITTATMPPFILELLSLRFDEINELHKKLSYKKGEFLNDINRHNISLVNKEMDFEDIIKFYYENDDKDSLKILVVLNTVLKSQEVFNGIKDSIGDDIEVNLLHAKFITRDRKNKEKKILSDGKTETKKKVIWVATQVVEASLDIDFDYLFTELSELNGLFQRFGRCNRKGKKDSSNTNIYVYLETNSSNLKKNNRGFIDYGLHMLSKDALNEWIGEEDSKIMTESNKLKIIEDYYTLEKIKNSKGSFYQEYRKAYRFINDLPIESFDINDVNNQFRKISSITIIPNTVFYEEDLSEKINCLNSLFQDMKSVGKDERKVYQIKYDRKFFELMEYTVQVGYISNKCFPVEIGKNQILCCEVGYTEELGVHKAKEEEGSIFI